jgi:hypothetical protein
MFSIFIYYIYLLILYLTTLSVAQNLYGHILFSYCGLLIYDSVQSGRQLRTFQRNIFLPFPPKPIRISYKIWILPKTELVKIYFQYQRIFIEISRITTY